MLNRTGDRSLFMKLLRLLNLPLLLEQHHEQEQINYR
jgi:hypothetical protein